MSAAQALRRVAAPVRNCAARYLGGNVASCQFDANVAAASVDLRGFRARRLSTETDSGLESQAKLSADQGAPIRTPPQQAASVPRLILQRTGDPESTGAGEPAALHVSPSDGSQKVAAKITNAPKYILKSDVLWFFRGCNLKPEDVVFMYDAKYRSKYIQISFSSVESCRLAQRTLAMKGRFGGRYLKLSQEEPKMDEANTLINHFRGRSLLMNNVPPTVGAEDVERFFSGYSLDNQPIKYLPQIPPPPVTRKTSATQAKQETENRVLIRFKTHLEALRALREKQGGFCSVKAMELRYVE
ncbi:hypothetical protein R1sor_018295 [Riccia sorocarpa]|uniref:RRM domain-containing protein n=1 Tax=Riccia sorocarpa TaxID=122646 RepID=A0ABD3I9A1_9MARC